MPASPGNLLEMQILRPHARSTESETLAVGSSDSLSEETIRVISDARVGLRTTALGMNDSVQYREECHSPGLPLEMTD